jgi:hypothetical protein
MIGVRRQGQESFLLEGVETLGTAMGLSRDSQRAGRCGYEHWAYAYSIVAPFCVEKRYVLQL